MKIVIPVDEDKQTVYKRTGKAPYFAIYEDDKLIKYIENQHAKNHSHDEEHSADEVENHRRDILDLQDCDVILAQAVGANMSKELELIGLKVQKIRKADGEKAQEVIEKFLNNSLIKQ